MTVEYQKVWQTMNDLELVTSKICSAREIIDNAVDKIQGNEYDKAELLMTAAYEFLEYYLQEFDEKFKLAWQATVGDLHSAEKDYYENVYPSATQRDIDQYSTKYQGPSFSQYTEEELNAMCDAAEKADKVKKWVLSVSEIGNNCFVTFPQDLLEAANLKEGDAVHWIDNNDGSFELRKVNGII